MAPERPDPKSWGGRELPVRPVRKGARPAPRHGPVLGHRANFIPKGVSVPTVFPELADLIPPLPPQKTIFHCCAVPERLNSFTAPEARAKHVHAFARHRSARVPLLKPHFELMAWASPRVASAPPTPSLLAPSPSTGEFAPSPHSNTPAPVVSPPESASSNG